MKNYIRDVIDRYIKHDYPEEVNQDFRTWLTDEERADEKEHELNKLWEATEAVTTPGYRDSLERMHELTGIGSRRRISGLAGSGSFIDNCFFYFYLSGIAEPPGSGPVASIYSYSRDTKYNFAGRYTSVDKFSKYFTLSTAIHG